MSRIARPGLAPGGSRCVVRRLLVGAWAGYVAIDLGHPWHGLGMLEVPAVVHGGCTHVGPLEAIERTSQWWIGFDCAHANTDLVPALFPSLPPALRSALEYRDLAYVRAETNQLAAQAEVAAQGRPLNSNGGEA